MAPMENTIQNAFDRIAARAQIRFGVDLSEVALTFDLDSPDRIGEAIQYEDGTYEVAINRNYLDNPVVLDEVLPHEVAHIVLYMLTDEDCGHNDRFMRICQALGGVAKAECRALTSAQYRLEREIDSLLEGVED